MSFTVIYYLTKIKDIFIVYSNALNPLGSFKNRLLFCLLTMSVKLYCFKTKYKAEYNSINFLQS